MNKIPYATQLANNVSELNADQLGDFLTDLWNNLSEPMNELYKDCGDEAGINLLFHLEQASIEWTKRQGN